MKCHKHPESWIGLNGPGYCQECVREKAVSDSPIDDQPQLARLLSEFVELSEPKDCSCEFQHSPSCPQTKWEDKLEQLQDEVNKVVAIQATIPAVDLNALLTPFVNIAKGIPDNWPGECILRFDQRKDGSIHLSYHGVNDASCGVTINQWRALLGVKTLPPRGGN